MSATAAVTVRVLNGFDDPAAGPCAWQRLLDQGPTRTVFQTWHWQRTWWEAFGRGRLVLVLAEREGRPVGLAPLFADGGMAFFVGSGGSDYLDFVGDVSGPGMLKGILAAVREAVPGLVGYRFYLVPDESPTGGRLREAAERLGWECHDEGDLGAPALMLHDPPGAGLGAAGKSSLVRHERGLRRDGELDVVHLRDGAAIGPHLEELFEQHVARWAGTPYPSLFTDPGQRAFYRRLCDAAGETGWLRFTRVGWNGRAAACHFGFCYGGSYLWYKPSYAVELARRSPGEVLLRQMLLAAVGEGATTFDFGLGEEAFKARFANRVRRVRTWGLYPWRG